MHAALCVERHAHAAEKELRQALQPDRNGPLLMAVCALCFINCHSTYAIALGGAQHFTLQLNGTFLLPSHAVTKHQILHEYNLKSEDEPIQDAHMSK